MIPNPAAERRNNVSHGRKPVELDPERIEPRAKRKLDRAQPQEKGRHNATLDMPPLFLRLRANALALRGDRRMLRDIFLIARPPLLAVMQGGE